MSSVDTEQDGSFKRGETLLASYMQERSSASHRQRYPAIDDLAHVARTQYGLNGKSGSSIMLSQWPVRSGVVSVQCRPTARESHNRTPMRFILVDPPAEPSHDLIQSSSNPPDNALVIVEQRSMDVSQTNSIETSPAFMRFPKAEYDTLRQSVAELPERQDESDFQGLKELMGRAIGGRPADGSTTAGLASSGSQGPATSDADSPSPFSELFRPAPSGSSSIFRYYVGVPTDERDVYLTVVERSIDATPDGVVTERLMIPTTLNVPPFPQRKHFVETPDIASFQSFGLDGRKIGQTQLYKLSDAEWQVVKGRKKAAKVTYGVPETMRSEIDGVLYDWGG